MVERDKQQVELAQETVDIAQELEGILLIYLVGKIAKALESTETKPEDLSDIRNEIAKEVAIYLPLLTSSSNKVIKDSFDKVAEELKGNIPKYSNSFAEDTKEYWKKYIKTKGTNFIVGDSGQKIPQYFTNVCDKYIKEIVEGSTNIDKAIDEIVNDLAKNGIKAMDYESGITRQIDVLARQQVVYAERQSTQDLIDKWAKENNHTIFEFSAHPNARPTHKLWQGKRFDTTGKEYPTLQELTHGENKDYNCRHYYFPVNKEDPYLYTKKELNNLETKPFEFKGKRYDGYQGTQLMRKYERDIRALKRKKALKESLGEDTNDIEVRIRKKNKEYREVCKLMDTYPRNNRLKVVYY